MLVVPAIASLSKFRDPQTGHVFVRTRTSTGIMISRLGDRGRPVRVCSLTWSLWEESVSHALVGERHAPGWPDSRRLFESFGRAVQAATERLEDRTDDARAFRHTFTPAERADLEAEIESVLQRGDCLAEWCRQNDDRIGRSTAYAWAVCIRAKMVGDDAVSVLTDVGRETGEESSTSSESTRSWIPRIIEGGG